MNQVTKFVWVVVAVAGTAVAGAQMTQPGVDAAAKASKTPVIPYVAGKHIYPEIAAAPGDVAAALKQARKEHKRVILDFGADWCGDCQVLDIYFHQSPNKEIVDKHFIEVKVNIGREDANLDIAHKYGVPVHGVPALAVINGYGKVIVAQDNEFSDMRYMQSSSLTAFLNKWKK
ncbi:thioredoxin family protein [Granulicella paludicola]|uniref:thioredoxin family protein n=1 Tax=Granulicella paludicola TaxID=474951 RepID=UPI0021E09F2F|nr:thioredoxin family protein [Granulicella paludicola]